VQRNVRIVNNLDSKNISALQGEGGCVVFFLWKRYRVLIEFPGGGVTCPSGGSIGSEGGT